MPRIQDFGPIRLFINSVDSAMEWNVYLRDRLSADFGHPVDTLKYRTLAVSLAIGALTSEADDQGNAQSWGDLARTLSPRELDKDRDKLSKAMHEAHAGLRALGAGSEEILAIGRDVEKWLSEIVVSPMEAASGRADFFARRKAQ
jgi:hypothetical protein